MSHRSFTWSYLPRESAVRSLVRLVPPPGRRDRSPLAAYCLLLVGFAIMGCEVQEPAPDVPRGPRLYPVHGTVRVDGKPLAHAVVVFLPAFSAGTHSVGETKADGTYALSHIGRPGAGRGDYRVVISYIVKKNGQVADLDSRTNDEVPPITNGKELIPPRYSDFSLTQLRASLPPDDPSATFDFALKGPLLDAPANATLDEPAQEKHVGPILP
jgi:hypothetical protein